MNANRKRVYTQLLWPRRIKLAFSTLEEKRRNRVAYQKAMIGIHL